MGFNPIKYENGTGTNDPVWVRFTDSYTNESLGEPTKAFD